MECTQEKRLNHTFRNVRIDESQLRRLANRFEEIARTLGQEPVFEIRTANEEDTIRTRDPDFFGSDYLPRNIASVSFPIRKYDVPVSVVLNTGGPFQSNVDLSVEGPDPKRVTGIFTELKSKVGICEVPGQGIVAFSRSFSGSMAFSILSGLLCGAAV